MLKFYDQTLLIFFHDLTFEEEQIKLENIMSVSNCIDLCIMFTKIYCIMSMFYY